MDMMTYVMIVIVVAAVPGWVLWMSSTSALSSPSNEGDMLSSHYYSFDKTEICTIKGWQK